MTEQMNESVKKASGGLGAAVLAYVLWGFFPIYFHPLLGVPAVELVSWRVVFTLPVCLAVVLATGQGAALRAAVTNPAMLGRLVLSAMAIGCNWLMYLVAIETHQVLAASLGYYINPLLNVLIGVLFLKERLNRLQWAAVILAAPLALPVAVRPNFFTARSIKSESMWASLVRPKKSIRGVRCSASPPPSK